LETVPKILSTIDSNRPVLLVDADEVLLRFVESLEFYFPTQGFELRLTSFQLTGNIYHVKTGLIAKPHLTRTLIADFFEACVDKVPAVDGAAEALAALSQYFQIIILSNVPSNCRLRRAKSLASMGMDYPIIANKGDKGPVAKTFAEATSAITVFIDDLPPQHTSVRLNCPASHRVHFVADPRLAKMIAKAPDANVRYDNWHELTPYLINLIGPQAGSSFI